MTYGANIQRYLQDGEIRSKNHHNIQHGYRTSFSDIVQRRGGTSFTTPCTRNVNDFVPFYFSPATAMAYTINQGNVPLVDPTNQNVGFASSEDIVYIVADPIKVAAACPFWFTDIACNSVAQTPNYSNIIQNIEPHIKWSLFDDTPRMGIISEIGYRGVCRWFHDNHSNINWINRTKIRMAEFLVQDVFPVDLIECFVIKSTKWEHWLQQQIQSVGKNIPVYVKSGCFF